MEDMLIHYNGDAHFIHDKIWFCSQYKVQNRLTRGGDTMINVTYDCWSFYFHMKLYKH